MPSLFEDEYFDIVGKARRGLGLSTAEAAAAAQISEKDFSAIESGHGTPSEPCLIAVARALELAPKKLADFALRPEAPRSLTPLHLFARLVLGSGFTANGYLLACPDSLDGVIVDPGSDPAAVLAGIERMNMKPVAILITHVHGDHVGALAAIQEQYPVPAITLKAEGKAPGSLPKLATAVEDGYAITAGSLRGKVLRVPGHTPGSAVFAFTETRTAFTGDAMFARSLGGCAGTGDIYRKFRAAAASKILGLPDATILCPGHGPLTTVSDEKRLNPFFP